jgi:DNA helicase-2/ATP-dependent DNA helicase PcrA
LNSAVPVANPASPPSPANPVPALDPEQEGAARSAAKGILVMAGAGTGKTRTIIDRLRHVVADLGVDPHAVVVATFTNKAAQEIRERAGMLLGKDTAKRLRMGTFHSLGAGILRRNARAAGLDPNFAIVGEDDSDRLLRDVVALGGHVGEGQDPGPFADLAAHAIRRWKSWGLTVEDVEDAGRAARTPEEERMARVYVAYQHEMQRRHYVDFADLCLLPYRLLRDDQDVVHAESNGVRHLLVDEAQDANPTQVLLARTLSRIHSNVFAVGDVDQSIYSFQGGFPDAIRQIAGAGCKEFTLVRNRRCTDEILAPAVALVGHNRRPSPKVLRSGRSGPVPTLVQADSERDEGARAAARIKELLAGGALPSEVCVLARSAYALGGVEEALVKAGIPYDLNGGTSFSEREEVRDVVAYLQLAAAPGDRLAFERIANKPVRGVGPQALDAIMRRHGGYLERPFFEVCATLTEADGIKLSGQHKDGLAGLARGLQALKLGFDDGLPMAHLLAMILDDKGLGYQSFVANSKDKARRRKLDNIAALRRLSVEEDEMISFVDRVALGTDDANETLGNVRLSTMHSSKGLEWDHVVCVGFDSAVIPSPKALETPPGGRAGDPWDGPRGGGVEEERRLAHVAFTRPRRTLDIFLPLTRGGKVVIPSPFLIESGIDPFLDLDPFSPKARIGRRVGAAGGRKGFGRG